jgi:hypothetical protein
MNHTRNFSLEKTHSESSELETEKSCVHLVRIQAHRLQVA